MTVLQIFMAILNMSEKSFEYLLQIRDQHPLEPETEFALQAVLALAED